MAEIVKDLERQIAEKNSILEALSLDDASNSEKIRKIKIELDKLLYQYLKALKCTCSKNPMMCWTKAN